MDLAYIIIMLGAFGIAALGLNVAMGYLGRIALAEIALVGIGAYIYSILTVNFGVATTGALLIALLASAGLGGLLGVVLAQTRGDYHLLVSLAVFVVVQTILTGWTEITGGPFGILGVPKPFSFEGPWFTVFVGICLLLSVLLCAWIERSRLALLWRAIRDDEIAAASLGSNLLLLRAVASALAGLLLSLSGIVLAGWLGVVEPTAFSISFPLSLLLAVCIGGLGRWSGALLGAFFFILLQEGIRYINIPAEQAAQWQQLIFAGTLILLVFTRPQGLVGRYTVKEAT